MGIKDRLRNLFENSNSEEVETLEETVETDADKEQFLALASEITDELIHELVNDCLLYTSPSPRDVEESRMPSSA